MQVHHITKHITWLIRVSVCINNVMSLLTLVYQTDIMIQHDRYMV